jgi:F-type H+-transporting ATPase subunit delta
MINRKAARRYTTALFEIAEETKITDKIKQDLAEIKSTIENSPDMRLFLSTPIINSEKKAQVISEIFKGKVHKLTIKFLQMICRKNREKLLYDITMDFHDLLNEKRGILETRIKTAVGITAQIKKDLIDKLEKYTGKEVSAAFVVDPSIIGGFVAQIQDTIIDASIKRQLELLQEKFKQGSFNN